jgi:hypothetical protein
MSYQFKWSFVMVFDILDSTVELTEIHYHFIDCNFEKSEIEMSSKERKETVQFFQNLLNGLSMNYSSDVYKKQKKEQDEKKLNKV